jgi:DNA-binding transcriptional regulator YiaG
VEISRISRKEAKTAIDPIAKPNTALSKMVAELKKRIAALEKENKRLFAGKRKEKETAETPPEPSDETKKARFTSTTIRGLRSRLGLSQAAFAKLAGLTTHAVYSWENKEGPLNLRDKTKAALLSIKGMGAREAKDTIK